MLIIGVLFSRISSDYGSSTFNTVLNVIYTSVVYNPLRPLCGQEISLWDSRAKNLLHFLNYQGPCKVFASQNFKHTWKRAVSEVSLYPVASSVLLLRASWLMQSVLQLQWQLFVLTCFWVIKQCLKKQLSYSFSLKRNLRKHSEMTNMKVAYVPWIYPELWIQCDIG